MYLTFLCVFSFFLLLTVYICLRVCECFFVCNFVLFVFAMGRVA